MPNCLRKVYLQTAKLSNKYCLHMWFSSSNSNIIIIIFISVSSPLVNQTFQHALHQLNNHYSAHFYPLSKHFNIENGLSISKKQILDLSLDLQQHIPRTPNFTPCTNRYLLQSPLFFVLILINDIRITSTDCTIAQLTYKNSKF